MYRSPIRLAGLTDADIDAKALQLARRKMLAELELSGGSTFSVNDIALSRQDINDLFEELGDSEKRSLHITIFRNKVLLIFLETGQLQDGQILDLTGIDAAHRRYFSPIAAEAIRTLLQRLLREDDSAAVYYALLKEWYHLLDVQDADRAYQPAFRYFTTQNNSLEELIRIEKTGVKAATEEIMRWATEKRLTLLNMLPDTFDNLRYQIASSLNNLSVAQEKNGRVKAANAIIRLAAMVTTSNSLMQLIRENQSIYRNRLALLGHSPKTLFSLLAKVAIFVVALIVLALALEKIAGRFKANDVKDIVAARVEKSYSMDVDQTYNDERYRALKKALATHPSTDTPKITPVYTSIRISCDSCADAFAAVWQSFFRIRQPSKDTLSAAHTIFTNTLKDMDVFVLTDVDSRYYSAIYLRPGQSSTFIYKGNYEAGFSFYIGNNWSDSAWHEILLTSENDNPDRSYLIRGSFMQTRGPDNYLNADYDQFTRTNIQGKPFRDTVNIEAEKDGRIIFQLGLDERDL